MDLLRHEQRLVNEQILPHIPAHAWQSTVAIVIVHEDAVHQFGTGILFAIGERSFLITAAHVLKKACEFNKTIGISTATGNFVAVSDQSFCSADMQYGTSPDPFDIGFYPLSADAVKRLSGKHFLRLDDIDFDEQSRTAVFSIFGFPAVWSNSSSTDSKTLKLKGLQYTAFAYDRETIDLIGYEPRFHLLMDAQPHFVTREDGSIAEFKTQTGQEARFPDDLGGISGCSVWRIGDLNTPFNQWSNERARIVAVQTSVYPGTKAIKATRWVAVTTLINEVFPALRPAIEMWRPR